MPHSDLTLDAALLATRAWVESFVIAEHLCPFAAAATRHGRARYCASSKADSMGVLDDLQTELTRLHDTPAAELSTTMLIAPHALADFLEFNDFLVLAQGRLASMGLVGELQLASFHPRYVFAGSSDDEPGDYTNRSPFPMLHLLREDEVALAIAGHGDVESIPARNVARLRELGLAHLQARLVANGAAGRRM